MIKAVKERNMAAHKNEKKSVQRNDQNSVQIWLATTLTLPVVNNSSIWTCFVRYIERAKQEKSEDGKQIAFTWYLILFSVKA